MTRNERQLKALEQELGRYSAEIKDIWKKAEDEDRETTADERGEVEERLKAIETLKGKKGDIEDAIKVEERVNALSGKLGETEPAFAAPRVTNEPNPQLKTLGEMFIESEGFKSAKANGFSGRWSTGMVDLQAKGTLLEGTGATPGTGGALGAPIPQMVPGVVEKMFQRLTVADLIASGTTNSNTLRYVVEGTATSGAAGVLEGGAKPESTLALSTVDEPVKKIATSLTVSDEMLEDAAAVQSYINGRLSLFVRIEEERQLLLGTGASEINGINGRSGVNTYPRGTVDNNAVALFKALNGTRGSAFLEPDAIIMNPANWQTTRLLTDTAGQFFGGGPFTGAYGGPQGPISSSGGQLVGGQDSIWGKPVVVTTAVGAGTALLGSFSQAAQLFRKSGIQVEASNSHDTYFLKNLVAIRAEQRAALAVYRPAAFTLVTGLQ